MKLLVFAQTPPPVHGQSVMVQTLVEGLHGVAPEIEMYHVNPALSRDGADIGRVRIGKFFALMGACLRALWLRLKQGRMDFYYVPAPAKRIALYRDWYVMLSCRLFFSRLILHWHASGLGAAVAPGAQGKFTAIERGITRWLLGRAHVSIVLAEELADDARILKPRNLQVIANGLDIDAGEPSTRSPDETPFRLFFLGMCSRKKGLFAAMDAMAILQKEEPGAYELIVAGGFPNVAEMEAYSERLKTDCLNECVRYVGAANEAAKRERFSQAGLFIFPTRYPHEGQPLVLIEAMAYDVPIVATKWRAIPGMLPQGSKHVRMVEPDASPEQLATAIREIRAAGPAQGELRAHYQTHYTRTTHLKEMAKALVRRSRGEVGP